MPYATINRLRSGASSPFVDFGSYYYSIIGGNGGKGGSGQMTKRPYAAGPRKYKKISDDEFVKSDVRSDGRSTRTIYAQRALKLPPRGYSLFALRAVLVRLCHLIMVRPETVKG